uniref:Tox-SGS domain-containing protein n=1 Tax=Panagrellus redivivus TaxID=6233 RepID=A0A7E4W755_PANRE
MAYLPTNITTHATVNLPCTGYGGLVFTEPHRKHKTGYDVFVQHNLAAFWKRKGLHPVTNGFAVPLLHSMGFPVSGLHSRSPGQFVYNEIPKVELNRRNLLASEMAEDQQSLNIFVTPECTDRKSIISATVSIKNPNAPFERLLKLKYTDEYTLVDLPSPALEVRSAVFDDCYRKAFARTEDSLLLVDFNSTENQVINLYNSPVTDFLQIPNLEEDLAFIDGNGFLWFGTIGEEFGRRKVGFEPVTISGTDCPRVLIVADESKVRLVDLREGRGSHEIFELDRPYCRDRPNLTLPYELDATYSENREKLFHVHSLPERPFATVASTDRYHNLLDHRVPGEAILSMPHATMNGGDYVFAAPPLSDTERPGAIYTYFTLSQCFSPQVTYWPMYLNTKESLWASLGPERELLSPKSILRHLEVNPGSRIRHFDESALPDYARSICYQKLPEEMSLNNTRALLLRQFDNGDIWFDNFSISPHPDTSYPIATLREQSLRNVEYFFKKLDNLDRFANIASELSEEVKVPSKSQIKVVSAVPNQLPKGFGFPETDLTTQFRHWSPFGSIGDVIDSPPIDADELEVITSVSEDAIFSNIVMKSWAKSDAAFRRYLNMEPDDAEGGDADASQNVSFYDQSMVEGNALSPVREEDSGSELDFDNLDVHSD